MSGIIFAAHVDYLPPNPRKIVCSLLLFPQWAFLLMARAGIWHSKAPLCVLILDSLFCFLGVLFGALQRPTADGVLRDGHLSLSGLQMRAHAMFSAQGLPLGSDTLEYAWLIDMQAGGLTGRVTVPQVCLFYMCHRKYHEECGRGKHVHGF